MAFSHHDVDSGIAHLLLALYKRRPLSIVPINQPSMPLNYSKWDALEVGIHVDRQHRLADVPMYQISDDSDIEGHPNVDHKSLVRCVASRW